MLDNTKEVPPLIAAVAELCGLSENDLIWVPGTENSFHSDWIPIDEEKGLSVLANFYYSFDFPTRSYDGVVADISILKKSEQGENVVFFILPDRVIAKLYSSKHPDTMYKYLDEEGQVKELLHSVASAILLSQVQKYPSAPAHAPCP